jgi:hypothetical protein
MSWFATVEAQIVIHAVFSFGESKMAPFWRFPFALSGIYFCIWRFFWNDLSDSGIWVATGALGPSERVVWSFIEVPVLIKISGFVDKGC